MYVDGRHRPNTTPIPAVAATVGRESVDSDAAEDSNVAGMTLPNAVIDHSAQSRYSDPGVYAPLLDPVEPTLEAVSALARNLVVHYRASGRELPATSREDIGLRWVDRILATDQARHPGPLTAERPMEDRVQGCCRDHSLLAVAALRHHGIPARNRVGFMTYGSETWNHDHVIVEAWLGGRWRRFDPEFESPLPLLPDPTDIAPGTDSPFLTSAHVWRGHRSGTLDVTRFGVAEGLGIDGDWFVYNYVIGEVAHRFGDELLLWDQWGAMRADLRVVPPADLRLVDEVADLLIRSDDGDLTAEAALLARYQSDARLHPGRQIQSLSPNGGVLSVDLEKLSD